MNRVIIIIGALVLVVGGVLAWQMGMFEGSFRKNRYPAAGMSKDVDTRMIVLEHSVEDLMHGRMMPPERNRRPFPRCESAVFVPFPDEGLRRGFYVGEMREFTASSHKGFFTSFVNVGVNVPSDLSPSSHSGYGYRFSFAANEEVPIWDQYGRPDCERFYEEAVRQVPTSRVLKLEPGEVFKGNQQGQ